jgi:hypothetical protein
MNSSLKWVRTKIRYCILHLIMSYRYVFVLKWPRIFLISGIQEITVVASPFCDVETIRSGVDDVLYAYTAACICQSVCNTVLQFQDSTESIGLWSGEFVGKKSPWVLDCYMLTSIESLSGIRYRSP